MLAILERPMVNPGRFKATISAIRCLEATVIALESLYIPYMYIDSKEWQRSMLPDGIKGAPNLKKASLDIGNRMWPSLMNSKMKDADSLLIAEYCKRKGY